jgi:mRNA interferase MazF
LGTFVKRDIIVFPFPYSDFSDEKRRPALVLADLKGDDLIACMITGERKDDNYSIELEKTDFQDNRSLDRDISYIRPNRLITVDTRVVLYCKAKIKRSKYDKVVEKITNIIK